MRSIKGHIITWIAILLTVFGAKNSEAADRIIESGSFIVDMGVLPQTYANGLTPYGLIYDLVANYNIPVTWVINPLKTKDGIDFSHNGVDYRGGPFIIKEEFIDSTIAARITFWQGQGVVGNYMVANDTVPVYGDITFFPIATLDDDNGDIAEDFYDNAGIPGAAYNFEEPINIDQCDDIFVMPHADPTWADHSNLKTWNATYRGYIWASCHAVSVLESLENPGNPADRMNFLSTNKLECYQNGRCTGVTQTHAGGSTAPYFIDSAYATNPLLQLMGTLAGATQNGSEQWYIPRPGSAWRPTTNRAFITSDGSSPREGVLFTYGRAFGNPNNGLVFYLAGHDQDVGGPDAVAAQRAFFNFVLTSAIEKGIIIDADFPSTLGAGISKPVSARVLSGGNGPYTYLWSTNCPSCTFLNANDSSTLFIPDTTLPDTFECTITVTVSDFCGRQSTESSSITILPLDTVCSSILRDTFSIPGNPDADSFIWTLSPGLSIVGGDPSDTLIIVSYFGVPDGVYDVCVVGVNCCGASDIVCNSFYVETCNDPVVATDDNFSVNEDVVLLANVLANDTDPDNNIDTSSLTILSGPAHGIASFNAVTGILTYTPDPNYNGPDTLVYSLCDQGLPIYCDTATVFITVNPVNDPPIAINDTSTIFEDAAAAVIATSNDSDPNDPAGNIDNGTIAILNGPSNGSATIATISGLIVYTPATNFNGIDTITYVICDDGNPLPALCDTALYIITVNPVNDQPQAIDDTATTNEENPIVINVPANDTDTAEPAGNIDPTTVAIVTGPSNGGTIVNPVTGVVTYTPNLNFNGVDSFSYVICDDGFPLPALCDTATVVITVNPVNDQPQAIDDTATTNEENPIVINVPANDTDTADPAGNIDPTTVAIVTGPSNGGTFVNPITGAIIYTPNANFNGSDTFTYVICDDGNPLPGLCDTAAVIVNVVEVNDQPVAVDDAAAMNEDTVVAINVPANDSDPLDPAGNIDPTTVSVISGPNNGGTTVNPVTGVVTYTPNLNFNGIDSFSYVICDDGFPLPALCDTATVVITVNPVNDQPQAIDDTATTNEESPVVIAVPANDTDTADPAGNIDPTTVAIVTGPSNGGTSINPVTGAITYTPNANFNGSDTFTYVICDDGNPLPGLCDTATVIVTVVEINDQPVAVDDAATMNEDTVVAINVPANDSDPLDPAGNIDPTTVAVISGPNNGGTSVDPVTGVVTYTPNANFNGVDSFSYVICDDGFPLPALCDTATVVITVNPINDQPLAVDDFRFTNEETPVVVNVPANDTDPLDPAGNIDPTSVTIIQGVNNGGTSIDPVTGAVTYTPNVNFNGLDSFIYVICDDGNPLPALCDTATAFITVNAVNDAPTAVNDTVTLNEDESITFNPTANDNDDLDPVGNIDSSSVIILVNPSNGIASLNAANGNITYTPNTNYNGPDSLVYSVCDDGFPLPPQCDTATVYFIVNPVNDPPISTQDFTTTLEDSSVVANVLTNDADIFDPAGNIDSTTVAIVSGPSNGTASVDPVTGLITYNPDSNFNGLDTLFYSVCDDGNPLPPECDTSFLIIQVVPVNDPPIAVDDTASTLEDNSVGIPVSANDLDAETSVDNASITVIQGASNGSTSVNTTTGVITYNPNFNFYGTDTFVYRICDVAPLPLVLCDTAVVIVTVIPVNDPPIAIRDVGFTGEDTAITLAVLSNDFDLDANIDTPTISLVTPPLNGGVSIDTVTGLVTYSPDTQFNGLDSFQYQICDDGFPLLAECDTAWVIINVAGVNDRPICQGLVRDTTLEDSSIVICLSFFDPDTNFVSIDTLISTNGTVTQLNDSCFRYDPSNNFNGTATIIALICDNGAPSLCCNTTVEIRVLPVNDGPTAIDDSAVALEDGPAIPYPILTNDSDPDDGLDLGSFAAVIPPANGTAIFDTNTGVVSYQPDPNFYGVDSFTYVICDNGNPLPVLCDTATVTINVIPINDTPIVRTDIDTVLEDSVVVIPILANDNDSLDLPDGAIDTSSYVQLIGAANGTATFDTSNGSLTYTPAPNYNGGDTIIYILCDNGIPVPRLCDTASVFITVLPVNDTPVAINDTVTMFEDDTLDIIILANDDDPIDPLANIDPTSVSVLVGPVHGNVSVDSITGVVTYIPDSNYNGSDSFDYVVCDDGKPLPALCDTARVYITVNPLNDKPIALDDSTGLFEDSLVVINVIANDDDPLDPAANIDPTSVSVISGPNSGGTSVDPVTGALTYTPNANFNGVDSFRYVVCDDGNPLPSRCDSALVIITVLPVNDTPLAVDDTASTNEGNPVTVNVPANDSDPLDPAGNIDSTTVAVIGGPSNGNTSVDPVTGAVTYTPDSNFNGSDTFTYVICDDGNPLPALCDTAIVVITVGAENDKPFAMDDTATTNEDNPVVINVPANDTDSLDPAGNIDPTTVGIVSGALNGTTSVNPITGAVTYTPNPNFNGVDSFTYVICDDGFPLPPLCDTALVVINVITVNDTPTTPPVIVDTTFEDSLIVICPPYNDVDVPGDTLTVGLCDSASNGTVTIIVDSCISYLPDSNFNGIDTFCYTVCDTSGACDTGLVIINVLPVNDPPVAYDDTATTNEDNAVTIPVLANDDDPEPNIAPATVAVISGPNNGGTSVDPITGAVTYTPDPNFNGVDSFNYVVCDSGMPVYCDTALVVVTVITVNDTPVVPPVVIDTLPEDSSIVLCPPVNDPDVPGDSLLISLCDTSTGQNGTVVLTGDTCLTYTPDSNFNGNDTICYVICDTSGACDTGIIVIVVDPVNDPPVAYNDTVTTSEDTAIDITVLANDEDPELNIDPTSVVVIGGPNNGGTSVDPITGVVTYTPNLNFNGVDSFTYVMCDSGMPVYCDTALVMINVISVNDTPTTPPVIVDTTFEDSLIVICPPYNDVDVPGDTLTVGLCDSASNGTVTIILDSCITYLPDSNFTGIDTFCYTVCDTSGACDTGLVIINVLPVNDPPVAYDDTATTNEDNAVTIPVLANDDDPEPNIAPATVAVISGPNNGGTSVDPVTGAVTYTPDPNFNGVDSFNYVVCDSGMPVYCDTALVVVTVITVNDTPVVPPVVTDTLPEDSSIVLCPPAFDPDVPGDSLLISLCDTSTGQNGTVVLTGDTCLTYTPDSNFNGNDTICYVICDTSGACDTGIIVIVVDPVNDPPVAYNDTVTTSEDTAIDITVLANDEDPELNIDPTSVVVIGGPNNGGTSVDPITGVVTYTPNLNFNGVDSFNYVVCDSGMPVYCDTALVVVTVITVNDTPVVPPVVTDTLPEDSSIVLCPPAFDPDVPGDSLLISLCDTSTGQNGTVVLTGDTCLTYTPDSNFNGNDTICYVICDTSGACDTGIIVIVVDPVNDPPVAYNDTVTTSEDTAIDITVLANDEDPELNIDPTSVVVIGGPNNGGTSVDPITGVVTYTPNLNFNGVDSFTYVMCDSGMPVYCDTALVVINVTTVNDTPVVPPVVTDTLPEDSSIVLCPPAFDPDVPGDSLLISLCDTSTGQNGTVVLTGDTCLTYTPDSNFNGNDTICYVICDTSGACDTGIIVIVVEPVNDPVVAINDTVTTPEDSTLLIDVIANDQDPENNIDSSSVAIVSNPPNGMVTVDPVTGVVTYTPNLNYFGPDSFVYVVCDTGIPVYCDTATVYINVTSVNDLVFANDDFDTILTDSSSVVIVLANDTDVDNNIDPTSVTVIGGPNNGVATVNPVTGVLTYQPDTGWSGTDTIVYAVCDSGMPIYCDTALVIITVIDPCIDFAVTANKVDISCFNASDGSLGVIASGGDGIYSYQWSDNFGGGAVNTGLPPGAISVTVTDSYGCRIVIDEVINEPAQLVVNIAGVNPGFVGGTGSASANPTGGTAPYTYFWSNGSSNQAITNLPSNAIYCVTVTDANGCQSSECVVISDPPCPLDDTLTSTPVSCFGGMDGTATATAIFPTGPVSYQWNDGQTTRTAIALDAGVYTVTITDSIGCTTSGAVVVVQPTPVVAIAVGTDETSFNGNDGTAAAIPSGGTPPYTFAWSNGATSDSLTGLAPGTYCVTVIDSNGCMDDACITIQAVSCNLSVSIIRTNPSCNGFNNGAGIAIAQNGTGALTYNWSNGDTTATISGLGSGNYTLTVTDQLGCTAVSSMTITDPPLLSIGLVPTNITCFGFGNGSIDLTVVGGTQPYNFNWSTGFNVEDQNNLLAGSYSVTVTDNNGCVRIDTVDILEPALLVVDSIIGNNTTTLGGSDGSATVYVSGGRPGYSYLWSNGNTTPTATSLSAGTYCVTVTDLNGCTVSSCILIQDPSCDSLAVTTGIAQIISCNGANDGAVFANATGGIAPYTYSWSSGAFGDTINNLAPNLYSVTVTDFAGCTVTGSISISEPTALTVTISPSDANCDNTNDGSATANPLGGTAPYSYLWSNGDTNMIADSLLVGTYQLTVTDVNGCQVFASTTINSINNLALTGPFIGPAVACENTTVSYFITPPAQPYDSLIWSVPSGSVIVSGQGTNSIIVQIGPNSGSVCVSAYDACGPTVPVCQPLIVNPAPVITFSGDDTICLGESANLFVSAIGPNYSYNWSPPFTLNCFNCQNPVATPAVTTKYYVVVTNTSTGCQTFDSLTIVVNQPPTAFGDSARMNEDTSGVTIAVTANDSDPEGDSLTAHIVTQGSNGTAIVNPDQSITYIPDLNFNGIDTVVYAACNAICPDLCDTALLILTVDPINDQIIAVNDTVSTLEDSLLNIPVLGNDIDVDNNIDTSSVAIVSNPSNGVVTVLPNGTINYQPDTNFNGQDSFVYAVCDTGIPVYCDTAVVYIIVLPVNDPPVANKDTAVTLEDSSISIPILVNDFDIDNNIDTLNGLSVFVGAPNGTVNYDPLTATFRYTPNSNFNGIDSFIYVLCDTGIPVYCDTAFVCINVIPVNDPPFVPNVQDTTFEDSAITICPPAFDVDVPGDSLVISICGNPSNGVVTLVGDSCFTYQPDTNFNGIDTLCVTFCDTSGACDSAQVVIVVLPVNDPPVANNDSVTVLEDSSVAIPVLVNDFDIDNNIDTLGGVGAISGPFHGTVNYNQLTGIFTYTPDTNFNGQDSFVYVLCDTGIPVYCDTAIVFITVIPVNDTPVAGNVIDTTLEDSAIVICPPVYDPDVPGDSLTLSLCGGPTNGIVVLNGDSCLTYQPDTNFNGNDTLCITFCDTSGACDTAQIIIVVIPVNDPPVAIDDTASVLEDSLVTIPILANDFDVDDNIDSSSVTLSSGPNNGTATYDPITGLFTYEPDTNFNGIDSFVYVVCDTGIPVYCDSATVIITVIPVNDPPFISDLYDSIPKDSFIVVCPPFGDVDVPGDSLNLSLCGGPNNGTAVILANDSCILYTPNFRWYGFDTFCVVICDTSGACDTAQIVIKVYEVCGPVIALFDYGVTDTNTAITIDVQGNDTIPKNLGAITSIVSGPNNGTVVVVNLDSVIYTPDSGFIGTDTFFYSVCNFCDSVDYCDTQMVIIGVKAGPCMIDADDDFYGIGYDPGCVRPYPVRANDTSNTVILVFDIISGPNRGVAFTQNDSIVYIPDGTPGGSDTLQYVICNACDLCDTATVIFDYSLYPCNNAFPTITPDTVTVCRDSCIDINVLANDFDTDWTQIVDSIGFFSQGILGSVTKINDSTLRYCPNVGVAGSDVFFYEAFDNGDPRLGNTAPVVVIIDSCPPTGPGITNVVGNIVYDTTYMNTPITFCIPVVDSTGDSVYVSALILNPGSGQILGVFDGDSCFTYEPDSNFTGNDTLIIVFCDDEPNPNCLDVIVVITVIDTTPNTPPVAVDDSTFVLNNDTVTIPVINNDFDPDGDSISLCGITVNPSHGTLIVIGNAVIYIPDSTFAGTDSFEYVLCDSLDSDTATVIIGVANVPVVIAVDDIDTILLDDNSVTIDLGANDTLPAGTDTSFVIVTDPAGGTVSIDNEGNVTYFPNDDTELDSFQYVVTVVVHGVAYSDTAWVYITVLQEFYIPNGFSPNGDGVNDVFAIPFLDVQYPDATLSIFNRWGDEVWMSNGPYQNDWTGVNSQGEALPDGTYYFILDYNDGMTEPIIKFVVIHR